VDFASRTETPALLASCWTSAGDVMPLRGPDTSPLPIRTRIEAVGRAGYTGIGLTRPDLVVARDTVGLETVARLLADNGITTVQLEWITDWWTTGPRRQQSDAVRADLFGACSVLGVDHIKVGADDAGDPPIYDQLCAGFDALADSGREAGVKIAFENTPFTHLVATTEQAIRFITDVGNANGGLLLDIWHAFRGGTSYADLSGTLPLDYLFGVEIDDGVSEVVGSHREDTFDNRLVCGTGEFDVPSFISAVENLGWTGPWGVEHMSLAYRKLPVEQALIQARDAALDCFTAAHASPAS
jgi:sugar phosphate isomerase/epimerase